ADQPVPPLAVRLGRHHREVPPRPAGRLGDRVQRLLVRREPAGDPRVVGRGPRPPGRLVPLAQEVGRRPAGVGPEGVGRVPREAGTANTATTTALTLAARMPASTPPAKAATGAGTAPGAVAGAAARAATAGGTPADPVSAESTPATPPAAASPRAASRRARR